MNGIWSESGDLQIVARRRIIVKFQHTLWSGGIGQQDDGGGQGYVSSSHGPCAQAILGPSKRSQADASLLGLRVSLLSGVAGIPRRAVQATYITCVLV